MTLPLIQSDSRQVCTMLRTKTAFGGYVTDGDESVWQDGVSTTAVFWCLKTMDMAGPDDGYAHPSACRCGRACYRPELE